MNKFEAWAQAMDTCDTCGRRGRDPEDIATVKDKSYHGMACDQRLCRDCAPERTR